jgi:hypothetical protein
MSYKRSLPHTSAAAARALLVTLCDCIYSVFPAPSGGVGEDWKLASGLQFYRTMKENKGNRTLLAVGVVVVLSMALTPSAFIATPVFAQAQGTQVSLSVAEKQTVKVFEKRVKQYADLRDRVAGKLPKPSDDATPEQIEVYKKSFQERVRNARAGAKHGDVFIPQAAEFIRAIVKDEFKGRERAELRDTVLREADTKAVPLRVNYPYPETQELLEMPATLLLRLPQLPKQIRYRFVGNNLLLVDRENGLIIDYMTKALP